MSGENKVSHQTIDMLEKRLNHANQLNEKANNSKTDSKMSIF